VGRRFYCLRPAETEAGMLTGQAHFGDGFQQAGKYVSGTYIITSHDELDSFMNGRIVYERADCKRGHSRV
jgi:hypothetical protein